MRVPGHQRKSYTWRWTAALAGLAVLVFALVMALAVRPAERVQAANFSVNLLTDLPDLGDTNANGAFDAGETDGGGTAGCDTDAVTAGSQCTLRAAVYEANRNGDTADTITFAAGGSGIITLLATLPVGDSDVSVAGADGLAASTTITGPASFATTVTGAGAGSCLTLSSPTNTIQGLVISGCGVNGITVMGNSTGNTIRANRIGTNAAGTAAFPNVANGIVAVPGANGNTIGGAAAADGNLISGNGVTGVVVPSNGNFIRANIIGMDVTGTFAIPNAQQGVAITGDANTVGGTSSGMRNLISGNTMDGVNIGAGAAGNLVQGNCIGTQTICSIAAPNVLNGVRITGAGANDNIVGGTAVGAGNTIAFNTVAGVDLTGSGTGNVVVRNVMFLNAGGGIISGGPPLITGCSDVGGGQVSCSGLSGGPGASIDVYRANVALPPIPQGDRWLCNTTAGGGGAWGCQFANPGGGSATATERLAPGNTSAFSLAAGIPAGPVATATYTPTPVTPTSTPTPVTPTNTPTRTATPTTAAAAATATAEAAEMESVALAAGCNPVASTYADNTAIATIAGAVSPSANLISIWWLDTASNRWLGYSPQFVAQSDLTEVDRLEAIFICVGAASTWSRPLI